MALKVRVDPLDILFSRYIRLRAKGRCERCGSTPNSRGLHCAHFISRRNKATRFDEENCLSLCLGCHQHFHEERAEFEQFMVLRLGQERFDFLLGRSREITKPDRAAIELYLKIKLAEMSID